MRRGNRLFGFSITNEFVIYFVLTIQSWSNQESGEWIITRLGERQF
jgi:hypothetical protein